jgi:release factor glutamine methyltransferase
MTATDPRSIVDQASAQLAAAGVGSPRFDAQTLAGKVTGRTRAELELALLRGDQLHLGSEFAELIAERARRVPLQHLTGVADFCGLQLAVGPGVFVPRPETEVVAEAAIAALRTWQAGAGQMRAAPAPVAVDLCAGSGALALALATAVPSAVVHAVEISDQAVAWAARNIARWAPQVQLHCADAATALPDLTGQVDVVVANPPYVPPGSVPVDPEVRDHDPQVALYGLGPDGLQIPRLVIAAAQRLLKPHGVLVIEHADVQQPALERALAAGPWHQIQGHVDLTGRPRYVTAVR